MIVDDLDIICIAIPPTEADPPLVVNSYRVLALTIPMQRLQAIAGWRRQITDFRGSVNLPEFSSGHLLNRTKSTAALTLV